MATATQKATSDAFKKAFGDGKPNFGKWTPSVPEKALPKGVSDQDVFSIGEDEENENWHRPPGSSHLERITIFDWPKPKPLQRYQTKPQYRIVAVIFKAKGRWPRAEYWYWFSNFSAAQATYDLMTEAESPGELIKPTLELDCDYYRKVA